jgi:hypothetical protein
MSVSPTTRSPILCALGLASLLVTMVLSRAASAQEVIVQQPAPPAVTLTVAPPPMMGPRIITDWEDGDPIPPGYRRIERTRRGAIIGGAVLFGSMYLVSVLVAAANDDAARASNTSPQTDALYIPAVGPFVQMMAKSNAALGNVALAIDGIAQSGGVALFVLGVAVPKTMLMRETVDNKPTLQVLPLMAKGATGLRLVGSF